MMTVPVLPPETVSLVTSDGIRLDADLYRPATPGDYPVLLMRQPYGRKIASTVVYAHPRWYASHGYIVVIQDVRGRGTSEGEFHLFAHEAQDGLETVNWCAQLPGSTGQVGMYGFSYQGMTQLYAASRQPEALQTLCPAMCGRDPYSQWAYHNGAFCLENNLTWGIQLSAETARRQGDRERYQQFRSLAKSPPFENPSLFLGLDPQSFLHDWLAHPTWDPYWQALQPDLTGVDLPMLHTGGWWDPYIRGTLDLFQWAQQHCEAPQQLWIGPWAHLPWGRRVGQMDYGPAAVSQMDRIQIQWFDHILKGHPWPHRDPVHLFVLGSLTWRDFPAWGHTDSLSFYLNSDGLASVCGGELTAQPQADAADCWVHDPWRPVPSHPPATDRSALDCRSDVLVYESEPLSAPLTLLGSPVLTLWIAADQPSFDLSATLSIRDPQGQVLPLTHAYSRYHQPSPPLTLVCHPSAATLEPGSRLRLSLSASAFPAYSVNDGQGSALPDVMELPIVTLTCRSGISCPSQIAMPLAPNQDKTIRRSG